MSVEQRAIATVDECVLALQQLSDHELQRLYELARIRAAGLNDVDGRDLLHDAITRMLLGNRSWPREVPLLVFLRETMRSIASDHWRRREMAVVVTEADIHAGSDADYDGTVSALDESTNPEPRAVAADVLAQIEEMFRHDADALAVMEGMVLGKTPNEIQEENAMDRKRYATTQRRIRRGLNQLSNRQVGLV